MRFSYPQIGYQVGRACAVAGYLKLYKELDILPDVYIAEEARGCGNNTIFDNIMAHLVRYNVMDNYMRSINIECPQPGYLNGDTAVWGLQDDKQWILGLPDIPEVEFVQAIYNKYSKLSSGSSPDFYQRGMEPMLYNFGDHGYEDQMFNITEDMNVELYKDEESKPSNPRQPKYGDMMQVNPHLNSSQL